MYSKEIIIETNEDYFNLIKEGSSYFYQIKGKSRGSLWSQKYEFKGAFKNFNEFVNAFIIKKLNEDNIINIYLPYYLE